MYSEVWLSIESSCCLDSEVLGNGVCCVYREPGVFRESGCVATKLSLPPQNIQSTNWQSMRFKPPPPNSSIGWRVEFRPLEVSEIVSQVPDKVRAKPYLVTIVGFYLQIQLTDFENAALVVFVVLLTRAILSFKLNLYIPMSKVSPVMTPSARSTVNMTSKHGQKQPIWSILVEC